MNILLIRLRFLGDVLLSTPAVRAIRKAHPRAKITYAVAQGCEGAVRGNPHVDELLVWPAHAPLSKKIKMLAQLRRSRYDVAVDWWGSSTSALMAVASRAPIRVGFGYPMRRYAYTHVLASPAGRRLNAIEVYLQALESLNIPRDGTHLTFEGHAGAEGMVNQWMDREEFHGEGPVIGVFPGATWGAKRWPAERVASALQRVADQRAARVMIFEGPKDGGCAGEVFRRLPASLQARTRMVSGVSFAELAAWIKRCRVFLTNDAAPMHLAAALNVPTVAVFGPGDKQIWFPYGAPHVAFQKSSGCCQRNECIKAHACLNAVTVDEVVAALEQRL